MHERLVNHSVLEDDDIQHSVVGNQRRNVNLSASGIVGENNRTVRNSDDDFLEPIEPAIIAPILEPIILPLNIPPARVNRARRHSVNLGEKPVAPELHVGKKSPSVIGDKHLDPNLDGGV